MRLFVSFVLLIPACAQQASLKVTVNQAGYLIADAKVAIITGTDEPVAFRVRRAPGGAVAFEGKSVANPAGQDVLAGEKLAHADFSGLKRAGRYYVEVEGGARSGEFEIGANVYRRAYVLAMRSFYGQRCGTDVNMGPEFKEFHYKACHTKGAYHASSGKQGGAPSVKGWHDAGDYGRYVVNSGLTTGTLLWAWEFYGDRLKGIALDIPKNEKRVPDYLDEVRWNLDWMMTMQDADGGVFHKQTTERFSGFVMPEADPMPSVIIGTGSAPYKSTCATADFAAVMAIAARVYKPYDAAFAKQALAAAEKAWAWGETNPKVLFRNPQGVSTGAYGDGDCTDERLWASAEMWRTAGEERYREAYLKDAPKFVEQMRTSARVQAWPSVGNMGVWAMALAGKGTPEGTVEAIGEGARKLGMRQREAAWRIAMQPEDYVWGSNGVAANQGMFMLVAAKAAPKEVSAGFGGLSARQLAGETLHYILGRNVHSVSWVTHVGTSWFMNPHHRPSGADGIKQPWPGLLSGGPNRRKQDPAMKSLADGLPPMKMYLDDQESYATNENAINWNAALVFVLAGLLN